MMQVHIQFNKFLHTKAKCVTSVKEGFGFFFYCDNSLNNVGLASHEFTKTEETSVAYFQNNLKHQHNTCDNNH